MVQVHVNMLPPGRTRTATVPLLLANMVIVMAQALVPLCPITLNAMGLCIRAKMVSANLLDKHSTLQWLYFFHRVFLSRLRRLQ